MDNRKSFSWKVAVAFFALFVLAACRVINASPGSVQTPDAGNYNLSINQIKEAAQAGDPDAQYALGYSYYYGKGLPQDMETATFWIRKAAAQGQPQAVKALVLLGKSDSIYKDNRDVQKPNSDVTDGKITPPPQGAAPVMGSPQSSRETPVPPSAERQDFAATHPCEGAAYSGQTANELIRKAEVQANRAENNNINPPPSKVTATADTTVSTTSAPTNNTTTNSSVGSATATTSAPTASNKTGVSVAVAADVTPKPSPASTGLTLDDLMHSPGNYYTVQLLAASQENEIRHYIESHELAGKTVSYHANRNGKDWYILTYGVYKTRQEAERAIQELPTSLRGLKPWVNSIAAVKVSMAKTTA